jgi:hypothetical protein
MIHTFLRFGRLDHDFRHLTPETLTRRDKTGVEVATAKVNGFQFPYMQCGGEVFVAVGVEGVVLRVPLLLILERHTEGKGFCTGPHIGDEAAMHLLVDMIVENPEKRDILGRLLRKLGSPEEASPKGTGQATKVRTPT